MMDLHQLSYCNAADENVFTRIIEKRPDILLVNTCRVLHSFPQLWNAGEVIRGGHQNNVFTVLKYYWFYSAKISNILYPASSPAAKECLL